MEQFAALWRARLLVVLFLVVFCVPEALAQESAKARFMRTAIDQLEREMNPPENREVPPCYAPPGAPRCPPQVFGVYTKASPRPFLDWDWFYIDLPLEWKPNPGGPRFRPVIVPEGFVSDLASVPQPFWNIYPTSGRYAYPAIVHDYLYWSQTRNREEADNIFKIALQDLKVSPWTIQTLYYSVRLFGQKAWDANAKAKAAGEKRILKKFPPDPQITWSEWRSRPGVFDDELRRQPAVADFEWRNQPAVVDDELPPPPAVFDDELRNQPAVVDDEWPNQPGDFAD